MLVGGLFAAGGDVVDVHIEGAGRFRVQQGGPRGRGLAGLARGHRFARGLPRVPVATRLEPAVELPVVQEEDASRSFRSHDHSARSEVAFADAAVEGIRVRARDERADGAPVPRLLLVGRGMVAELLVEADGSLILEEGAL